MDCSLPGSSFHGILQARILEWVAISVSRVSSQPRDVGVDMSIQGNSSEEISWQQKVHSELESPLAENPGGRRDGVGGRGDRTVNL